MKFEFLGKLREDDEGGGSGGSGTLPVEEVARLSEQGYSETEITEELRNRGYSYGEINEALNAAVKESASQRASQPPREDDYYNEPAPQPSREPEPAPQHQSRQAQSFDDFEEEEYDDYSFDEGMTVSPEEEELIEIIVSEHVAGVENEMDQMRSEMDQLRNEFEDLKKSFSEIDIRKDEDEKVVVQKVNEMEEYFERTSSRMGGMEKALQQVLPSLVENVRELSSIVREMKDEEKQR